MHYTFRQFPLAELQRMRVIIGLTASSFQFMEYEPKNRSINMVAYEAPLGLLKSFGTIIAELTWTGVFTLFK